VENKLNFASRVRRRSIKFGVERETEQEERSEDENEKRRSRSTGFGWTCSNKSSYDI